MQKSDQRALQAIFTRTSILVAGMLLLVVGGMNLFTNLLQIRDGDWSMDGQNTMLSMIMTGITSIVPAGFGAWLVHRSTAVIEKK